MKRDLDIDEACWVEERQAWLAIALTRAQNARLRAERIGATRTLEQNTEALLANRQHIEAISRAMEIHKELRDRGYGAEPWLEEVYQRIKAGK